MVIIPGFLSRIIPRRTAKKLPTTPLSPAGPTPRNLNGTIGYGYCCPRCHLWYATPGERRACRDSHLPPPAPHWLANGSVIERRRDDDDDRVLGLAPTCIVIDSAPVSMSSGPCDDPAPAWEGEGGGFSGGGSSGSWNDAPCSDSGGSSEGCSMDRE